MYLWRMYIKIEGESGDGFFYLLFLLADILILLMYKSFVATESHFEKRNINKTKPNKYVKMLKLA